MDRERCLSSRARVRAAAVARAAHREGGLRLRPLPQLEGFVELTDRAAEAMKAALRKAKGGGVRVGAKGEGREIRLTVEARPRASDVVLESEGVPLYVARGALRSLSGLRIDFVRRGGREGFSVQPLGGCGCGPGCACSG